MTEAKDTQKPAESSARLALAVGLLVLLMLLTWNVARSGFASLLTTYAAQTNQISVADSAIRIGASNPDAHHVRATILESIDLPGAIAEHRQAALARPDEPTQPGGAQRLLQANRWTQGLLREHGAHLDCLPQSLWPNLPRKSDWSARHKWLASWQILNGPRSR